MKDEDKTKEHLIEELAELRRRNAELERLEAERKQAERDLRGAAAKWSSLVYNAPNLIAILDRDGVFQFVNRTISGLTVEEVVGTKTYDYIPPEYHDIVKEKIEHVFRTGEAAHYELKGMGPDGQLSWWYETSVGPLVIDEQVAYVTQISSDITERKQMAEALRESEEKYRTLVENSPTGIFISDAKQFIYVNQSLCGITGFSRDELLDMTDPVGSLFTPEDRERVLAHALARLRGDSAPNSYEVRGVRKDGEEIWLELTVSSITFLGRQVLQGSIVDITERRRMAEALRGSEEKLRARETRYRNVIALAGGVAYEYVAEAEGVYHFMDEGIECLTGYTSHEMTPELFSSLIEEWNRHPSQTVPTGDMIGLKNHEKEVTTYKADCRIRTADERMVWLSDSSVDIRGSKGEILRSIGMLQDITERKQSEEMLVESEARYRGLFEGATDSATVMEGYRFVECNNTTLKIFGCEDKEDILNHTPWDFSPQNQPDGRSSKEKAIELIDSALAGEPQIFYWKHTRKDGTPFDAEVSLNCLETGDKKLIQARARDITERKKAEEALRKSEERLTSFMDSASDSFYLLDSDLNFVEINQKGLDIIGKAREQVIGRHITKIVPDVKESGRYDRHLEVIRTGERFVVNNFVPHQVFGDLHFILKSFRVGDGLGVIASDITEVKKAEEALRESEERFRGIVENSAAGYFFIDREGCFQDVNAAWLRMHGYSSPDEIIGKHFSLAQTDADIVEAEKIVDGLLKGDAIPAGEFSRRCRDGAIGYHTFTVRPVRKEGEIIGLEGFLIDTTERRQAEEALREGEDRLRSFYEAAFEGIAVTESGIFRDCNDQFAEMFGYEVDELIDIEVMNLVAEADRGLVLRNIQSGYDKPYEHRALCKDGSVKFVEVHGQQIQYHGRPARVTAIHDITERRNAEEALRENESRYREIIAQAGGVVYQSDWMKQIYTFMDEGIERLTGYAPDEITPELFNGLVEESVPYASTEVNVDSELGRRIGADRIRLYRADRCLKVLDGRTVWVADSAVQFRNSRDELIGELGMLQDITMRKQMEEELRAEKEFGEGILSSMVDTVFIFDPGAGKPIRWNRSFNEISGYTDEEIASMKAPDDWYSEKDVELARAAAEQISRMGQATVEMSLITKDGRRIPTEYTAASIRNVEDGSLSIVAIGRDLTERKRMEEELLKIEKLESIGVLAGGIAHDLNNFLTAIVGNISLAMMYDSPLEKDRRLTEAEKACMQVKDLTQQLLTFSRGGAPILQTADIAGLLRDSVAFTLSGSNVGCEFSIPDDLWSVDIDEGQINQVINNLIINSQQAMPDGGKISISAENMAIGAASGLPLESGAYIKISVVDQGTGISQEHLQRIFDPFFTTKQMGSGLGLATSYSIIEKHNGHITVESQMGAGTTFHIYLPASPEGVLTGEGEEEKKPITGEGRILVMDDEELIRELVSDMLTSIGYRVTTAIDGTEAIELYKAAMESEDHYDAAIIDLTIPGGMGGKETIQRLVEIDPEVKAIVSSGYSNDPIVANFREYGFRGFVAKPYKTRELSEVLHRVITGTRG
ncbi:PAS domain S-box protein [Candidatus Poribacteria bacterium]